MLHLVVCTWVYWATDALFKMAVLQLKLHQMLERGAWKYNLTSSLVSPKDLAAGALASLRQQIPFPLALSQVKLMLLTRLFTGTEGLKSKATQCCNTSWSCSMNTFSGRQWVKWFRQAYPCLNPISSFWVWAWGFISLSFQFFISKQETALSNISSMSLLLLPRNGN